MSMSTNIADLPGPAPEDNEDNISQEAFEDVQERRRMEQPPLRPQQHQQQPIQKEVLYEQPSKIKMDIKKINKTKSQVKESSMFDIIKKEVNEENLLILIVLYIASTSLIDEYARKLLSLMSFNTFNSFTVHVVKALGLFILFIMAKYFLLPYIKI
jgi:hypothetical protein